MRTYFVAGLVALGLCLILWLGQRERPEAAPASSNHGALPAVAPSDADTAMHRADRSVVMGGSSADAEVEASDPELVVRILSSGRLPVAGVLVRANDLTLPPTDADGVAKARFRAGTYSLRVAGDSLPAGLLEPPLQFRSRPNHAVPVGFYAPEVELVAGGRHEVVIELLPRSEVTGVVVDRDGQPIEGCSVRLQSRSPELVALSFDALTGPDGLYRFPSVPSGVYGVRAHSRGATPRAVAPSAWPQRIEVPEGGRIVVPPMVCGDDRAVLVGAVLDQDGGPIVGVPVQAHAHEVDPRPSESPFGLGDMLEKVMTDAAGRFELRVPATLPDPAGSILIAVQAHMEGSLLPYDNPLRVRRPIPRVILRPQVGVNDLGELRGELSRAFVFELTVITNEDAVRRSDPQPRHVSPPDCFVAPLDAMHDESRWTRLRMHEGRASYACDTPSESCLLVVRRPRFRPLVRQLDPTPGRLQWEITYP
jgi:hypothetical protein